MIELWLDQTADILQKVSELPNNGYHFVNQSRVGNPCVHQGQGQVMASTLPSRRCFNTKKYFDQLSSPTESCGQEKTHILDSLPRLGWCRPLVFIKTECQGDRIRTRDLITSLLALVPDHEIMLFSCHGLRSIQYQKATHLGLSYTYLQVDLEVDD